jgi:hypothetical protein
VKVLDNVEPPKPTGNPPTSEYTPQDVVKLVRTAVDDQSSLLVNFVVLNYVITKLLIKQSGGVPVDIDV